MDANDWMIYQTLEDRLPINQHMKSVFVVFIEVVDLGIYEVQARLVDGELSIGVEDEVAVHAKLLHPFAGLPGLENSGTVLRPAIAGVHVFTWEQSAVRPVMRRVQLPGPARVPRLHFASSQSARRFRFQLQTSNETYWLVIFAPFHSGIVDHCGRFILFLQLLSRKNYKRLYVSETFF